MPEGDLDLDMSVTSVASWPILGRRGALASFKLKVREERKKIIRISSAKYRSIDDHENGLQRFVLIRNTLRRLQREAREEKLARHRALAANVSPSYLSASRPRSPSPPCDVSVPDMLDGLYVAPTPLSAMEDDDDCCPLGPSSPKRPRLILDGEDKENEDHSPQSPMELDEKFEADSKDSDDVYDAFPEDQPDGNTSVTSVGKSAITPAAPVRMDLTTAPSSYYSSNTCGMTWVPGRCLDWCRQPTQTPHQYPSCGHSSFLGGNDLQSVVFHSLIASLES